MNISRIAFVSALLITPLSALAGTGRIGGFGDEISNRDYISIDGVRMAVELTGIVNGEYLDLVKVGRVPVRGKTVEVFVITSPAGGLLADDIQKDLNTYLSEYVRYPEVKTIVENAGKVVATFLRHTGDAGINSANTEALLVTKAIDLMQPKRCLDLLVSPPPP